MLVTVITINYNDLTGLKKTVQSVVNQSYRDIEYIVIDGGSTDGSTSYISNHLENIAHYISEKDNGPYDAMNKGIDLATGDYLLFLNAGDYFEGARVIENFVSKNLEEDIIYGNTLLDDEGTHTFKEMPIIFDTVSALTNTVNHQSIFFKKRLFKTGKRYDLKYKIVADWVFINDAIIFGNASTLHIDLTVAVYDVNGLSSNKEERQRERALYIEDRFGKHYLDLLENYNTKCREFEKFKSKPVIKHLLSMKTIFNRMK